MDKDFDHIDLLIDTDPIELGRLTRALLAALEDTADVLHVIGNHSRAGSLQGGLWVRSEECGMAICKRNIALIAKARGVSEHEPAQAGAGTEAQP